jgi:ABC-type multidrug transport system fused ATPase/permease subunit
MLRPEEQHKAIWLSLLVSFAELFQLISMVIVLPVVSVIVQPDMLETNERVASLYAWIGAPPLQRFVMLFASLALIFLVVGQVGTFLVNRKVEHFAARLNTRLSEDMLNACIGAPYAWFLGQNAAALTRLLHNDITLWGRDFVGSLLRIFSFGLTVISTALLVIAVTPIIGVAMLAGATLLAVLAFWFVKPHQLAASARSRAESQTSMVIASQSLTGIKDVKANDTGHYFTELFRRAQGERYLAAASATIWGQLPSMAIMLVMQSGLLMFMIAVWLANSSGGAVAAYMALIVIASARITPAVIRLQAAFSQINAALPWVAGLQELRADTRMARELRRESSLSTVEPAGWRTITFENVSFSYPDASHAALHDVSCSFESGHCYGIVGPSGAGKSTFIDLFLGLLEPAEGRILVDENNLCALSYQWWLSQIGYVPQQPFFIDDSLAANIAFGQKADAIDRTRLLEAARAAGINELAVDRREGYDMPLGDRAGRVSGGQRQRIAIARALYRQPALLILDEPTAALDAKNEALIVDTIKSLKGGATIFVISHRDATLSACDQVLYFDGGRVTYQTATGTSDAGSPPPPSIDLA